MVEDGRIRQVLASKECASAEKVFGGIETPDRMESTPRRCLRAMRQVVTYLIGDASELGFGLVMWSQSRLVSEAGEFNPLYQGRYSNFGAG